MEQNNKSDDLVEELVEAQKEPVPVAVEEKKKTPKRNSKDEIIQKILQLSEEVGEPVTETNSQLKRMSKKDLTEKLANLVEKRIEMEAQKCLGIDKEQAKSPYCVNLAALKMVHEIAVNSTEAIVDKTSHRHGMTLKGFKTRMKESQESIDIILAEIAQQYPEVLEKFSSPWVRLGLLWTSNVMLTIKKKQPKIKNVAAIRSRPNPRIHPV